MTTDFERLGKRGSYRLGQLRSQGIRDQSPPVPFRPRFSRNYRRGPAMAWILGLLIGVAAIAGGTVVSWWFVPFAVGLAAGLANRIGDWRPLIALPAVVMVALAGWGIPLGWQALHGLSYAAVARVTAVPLGLPATAAVGVTITLLIAVVQALVGYWLGRALTPGPADI